MLKIMFLAALLAISPVSGAFAAADSSGSQQPSNVGPSPLFAKAYALEYYKDNNVREVDDMFAKAAKEGDPFAIIRQAILSVPMAHGKEARQKAREEACPKVQAIANKWMDSDQSNSLALFYLAEAAMLQICGKVNRDEAAKFLEMSAKSGTVIAQVQLGKWLIHKKEAAQGVKWYEKAAAKKFPEAFYLLGRCYLEGIGVEKNPKIGMEYIDKALAIKNPRTDHMIAQRFLDGDRGFPKDLKKAETLLDSLVKRGYYFAEDDLEYARKELKAKQITQ